jgi:hypothetical protein
MRATQSEEICPTGFRPEGHEKEWSLEVINAANASIVWDDLFPTDEAAYAEFERTVAEEGMQAFLENAKLSRYSKYGVSTSSIHFMNARTRRDRLLRCATTRDTPSARRRKSGMTSTSAPLSKYRPIPTRGA